MELDKKRIGYCRNLARKVLHDTQMMKVPVPVEEIAKYYGFQVKFLDQPPDKFSGILLRDKKAIGINQHHHPVRQRFSLSHELGHYFLDHPDASEEIPDEEGMEKRKTYEAEADEFAAELLMPRELLKSALKEGADIETLRTKFQVSRHVVAIQLRKHGFLMKI
ncbi:MAG: ImmA/IrrE family metallo-endopeptidase [candidate division KSB1 bacterium]|nr:ImmA/IrrE family metallo-endopeptidase [candidate division KSB1 bacterium]MDZ7300714.1 ImmA/IrrE family metallo-endopeptidase [candidate division KSB1 bacterium]MDZ7310016.1 ImmA/IrrE family metallo-endopeptidase [candidate division KSB1 bacterium]